MAHVPRPCGLGVSYRSLPPCGIISGMTDDGLPKSAYELAMARLRKKDIDEGTEPTTLTDDQKRDLAEARNFYEAKLAEIEVLYHSALMRTTDPEARAALEQNYGRDREHLTSERDAKIARIRKAGS
jgi:hypothetical protein